MPEEKLKKAENHELSDLRRRLALNNKWFKGVFLYNCALIIVFIIMLFPLTYGASLITQNAASSVFIAIAGIAAAIPLFILDILTYMKNRRATAVHLFAVSALFLAFFAMSCYEDLFLIFILTPFYLLSLLSLFCKNKRNVFAAFAISFIIYCIFALENDIDNLIFPNILLLFSILLDSLSFRKIKDYKQLEGIYGFPYFNERFNDHDCEYRPEFSSGSFVSDSPDEAPAECGMQELKSVREEPQNDYMETIDFVDISGDISDIALSDRRDVEKYAEKLRSLKENSDLKL